MLTSITVENFRGIERLKLDGLGRVNLVIGRNDCGKTALLEAVNLVSMPEDAGRVLAMLQLQRLLPHDLDSPGDEVGDFEGFWKPVFHGGKSERGFALAATSDRVGQIQVKMHTEPAALVTTALGVLSASSRMDAWQMRYEVNRQEATSHFEIKKTADGVFFPSPRYERVGALTTGATNQAAVMALLSSLKKQDQEELVLELLRHVNPSIRGTEILSPEGNRAVLFIRFEGGLMHPFKMLGEGAQRCLEIAVAIAAHPAEYLTVDEIENGLHHTVVEPLWNWIAKVSASKHLQVFATTHSEECVQAACRVFSALQDDGLRVIRLDKREHETTAAVYDRDMVAAADRMGVEIRG